MCAHTPPPIPWRYYIRLLLGRTSNLGLIKVAKERSLQGMAEVVTERQQSLHLILFTPKEVAEELTLRDSEMLRRISPDEIRHGAWMHNDKASLYTNTSYTSMQPVSYIYFHNTLCYIDKTA